MNYQTVNKVQFGANKQAIVKFILKDESGNAINAKSFTIDAMSANLNRSILRQKYDRVNYTDDNEGPLTFTLSGTTNVIYAALMISGSANITITAETASDAYAYGKTSVSFDYGKYYEVTVKMYKRDVDLASLNANYEAKSGQVLSGTLPAGLYLDVVDGATVTLKNANINASSVSPFTHGALCCNGNVTLLLEGTNVVKGNPAVFSAEGKTLIIDGNGSLTATSEDTEEVESCSAAIGSPYYGTCGNIIIKGGYIKATSESGSAGIGCGYFGNCGDITITGGTVEAYGHDSAGIGCSEKGDNNHCGKITIANTVTKVVSATSKNGGGVIGQTMGSCPSVKFGDCEVWYESTWHPMPMVDGDYGGLHLTIDDDGKRWTLTPVVP